MRSALRDALRPWIPPAVLQLIRGRAVAPENYWRGVYPRLSDVPTWNPVFDVGLITRMATVATTVQEQMRSGVKPYLWHEALALLAGVLVASRDRLRVVDFGGGLGTGYMQLRTSLPAGVIIEYRIVDGADMCAKGETLFPDDPAVTFSTDLDAPEGPAPDIVYVNSVLQYIDDYAGQLRALAALKAPYLLLARLTAGDVPTFASQQVNVPGQILPYWFLNADEVAEILAGAGYRRVCDELTEWRYDQSNLPATHRVERFRNMLFVPADAA